MICVHIVHEHDDNITKTKIPRLLDPPNTPQKLVKVPAYRVKHHFDGYKRTVKRCEAKVTLTRSARLGSAAVNVRGLRQLSRPYDITLGSFLG